MEETEVKILVLGATGMAGHTITLYFKEAGHNVTAFARNPVIYCRSVIGNALDLPLLKNILVEGKYDAVVNSIGILNEAAERNKATAIQLNSYLPHYLSECTSEMKTKVLHMSTDCVFSGETGRYTETSLRDGRTFYDRTKALGELENSKDLTFRTSIVGPDCKSDGIGLFNWFMQQKGTIRGYTKAFWTGVTTLTLAKAMEKALEVGITGLYNLVNEKPISKYELLNLFNKHLKNSSTIILPDETVAVDKSLVNSRQDFPFSVPNYEDMILEMKDWIERHRELYPHYSL